MIKAAVNCLVMEPISKTTLGCVAWRVVRSETPYPWTYRIVPFLARATAMPGTPCCCMADCTTPSTVLPSEAWASGGEEALEPPHSVKASAIAAENRNKEGRDRGARIMPKLPAVHKFRPYFREE